MLDLIFLVTYKGEHLHPTSRRVRSLAPKRGSSLLLGDEMPHIPIKSTADERDCASDCIHWGDRVPEDQPRNQHGNGNFKVASNIEGHCGGRMDHIEDGEVQAKCKHP